jgi:hypothetical protein
MDHQRPLDHAFGFDGLQGILHGSKTSSSAIHAATHCPTLSYQFYLQEATYWASPDNQLRKPPEATDHGSRQEYRALVPWPLQPFSFFCVRV